MIKLQDATFSYRGSESPALNRVNLEIAKGEFVLVCGATGSGKSTLLKIINGLAPHFTGGVLEGSLVIDGEEAIGRLPHDIASRVGYVNQQPESSFVCDTVREELVFGMEQLGFLQDQMETGLSRVTKLLELEVLLDSPLETLSGGWQQRVAIGAALAAGQQYLLLDEPTSALDPESASEVIRILESLAHEHDIGVILVEHRIERAIELVDSVVVVAQDGLVTKGGVEQFRNYHLVPPVIALSERLNWDPLEISISKAAHQWKQAPRQTIPRSIKPPHQKKALKVSNISVNYDSVVAVADVSFEISSGEIAAVMGANGSGKSSLLWAIHGLGNRASGTVETDFGDPINMAHEERHCVITLVPQRAADLLFLGSLSDELEESDKTASMPASTTATFFESLAGRLDPKLHPRDLSSGQQLALVLAVQMAKGAGILLLDEPTRGLDYSAKKALAAQLKQLSNRGTTILLASHDVEFVALVAERVLRLESGRLVEVASAIDALGTKSKTPTQIAQITGAEGVLTLDDISVES